MEKSASITPTTSRKLQKLISSILYKTARKYIFLSVVELAESGLKQQLAL